MTINSINDYSNYATSFEVNQSSPLNDRISQSKESAESAKSLLASSVSSDEKSEVLNIQPEEQSANTADDVEIIDQLNSLNERLPLRSTSLVFEFDDANDPPVIKVVDKDSGDVIREIPPKELREIAQALTEIADNLNSGVTTTPGKQPSGILINSQS